ncbi:ski oncogene-like isoform X2 [Hetaerina americana]|uniref:ski oncogene-like isoform X2 n=1 Tax=Hetaerina americana TaxID=62018 RepID=UPI003A7F5CC6
MMETVVPYSPHLKKVLKTYQLSAVKSLSGPRTVLDSAVASTPEAMEKSPVASSLSPAVGVFSVKREPGEDVDDSEEVTECNPRTSLSPSISVDGCAAASGGRDTPRDPFLAPPPFPIQQQPILTTPDQSRSERSETILEGEAISCFVVGGEKRLCLPQILNSVLRDFSLAQINQVCDELQIFCSRCNPTQLEVLKVASILPASAPSCGLITKTDAERLVSALLHRCPQKALSNPSKAQQNSSQSDIPFQLPTFRVYHECFGKCEGICSPQLYTCRDARCIECAECRGLFSPQRFVCHAHRPSENRTCHWGFDSSNWRAYLLLAKGQSERLSEALDAFKRLYRSATPSSTTAPSPALAPPTGKRKQVEVPDCKEDTRKKAKYDSSNGPCHLYAAADPYHAPWYDLWPQLSPFIPWPSSFMSKEAKGLLLSQPMHRSNLQPSTPPILRDSVAPSYLSRGPPVLLHPERVVPLSESERFERTFQPNVALAPAQRRRRGAVRPSRPLNTPPQIPRSLPPTDEMDSSLPEEGVASEFLLAKEVQRNEGDVETCNEPEDPVAEVLAVLGEELAEGEVGQAVLQVVRRHWEKITHSSVVMSSKEMASKVFREENAESIQEEIAVLESRLESLREKLASLSAPISAALPPSAPGSACPQTQSSPSPHESLPSPVNTVIKTEPLSE